MYISGLRSLIKWTSSLPSKQLTLTLSPLLSLLSYNNQQVDLIWVFLPWERSSLLKGDNHYFHCVSFVRAVLFLHLRVGPCDLCCY